MGYLIFILIFLNTFAQAGERADPKPDMHAMAQEIVSLQKYLLSDSGFSAPGNEAKISASLDKITGHVKHLQSGSFKGDPVLKTNVDLLASHMEETQKVFKAGNKNFARYMAQSSLQMCIACHTREKTFDFALPEADLGDIPPMEKAVFYFATRQFEKGRVIYEEVIAGYPGNGLNAFQLRSALMALVVFYAKVKEDPKAAAQYFGRVEKRKDLPSYLQSEIKAWASDFRVWEREKPVDMAKATEMELVARAKKLLAKDDFSLIGDSDRKFHVRRLRASSLLHRALDTSGGQSPSKGQAVLLLGQIYHRISYNLFFRFGEMYLKACIREYKKTKLAKDCYDSLEEAVAQGYTGTAGTDIPEDEQVELFQLKRLAY